MKPSLIKQVLCFVNKTYFSKAKFCGEKTDFCETLFSGEETYFYGVEFNGTTTFYKFNFKSPSVFSYIKVIKGCVEFISIDFTTYNHNFTYINEIVEIKFIDCKLNTCSFVYSNLTNFKFINVTWPENGKVYDEELIKINWPKKKYKNKKAKEQDYDERQTHIKHTEEVYNQLKNKYRKDNKHYLADQFHKGELEMKRIQHPGRFQLFSWEGFYKIFSNYGMSWRRPIWCAFIFIIIFAIITWFDGGIANHDVLVIKRYDTTELKYVSGISLFAQQPVWFSKAIYSLYYHFCNCLYIPQKHVEATTWLTQVFSRIENMIITSLFILAGFAVRRKFKT